jgi:hypothetical protein
LRVKDDLVALKLEEIRVLLNSARGKGPLKQKEYKIPEGSFIG